MPAYAPISWAVKARRLSQSLQQVEQIVGASNDPLKHERFFVVANPVPEVEKLSTSKRKAPEGKFKERTEFGGAHGKVFDRLGMDLLRLTDAGQAIVHAKKATVDQLRNRSASLESLGAREQSRWATIDSFEIIPLQLRVDSDWLNHRSPNDPSDVIFELQPVLPRIEVERVLRAIAAMLLNDEKLTGTGTDFSGRHWLRGVATQRSIRRIAKDFFSVQTIHSPLRSIAAGKVKGGPPSVSSGRAPQAQEVDASTLPCVAVLDMGVPSDHGRLQRYRRGQFVPLDAPRRPIGHHGSYVASRVVFGECETHDDLNDCVGRCSFFSDGMVAENAAGTTRTDRVDDKYVMEVLRGIVGAAPDVRVFNLSFGYQRPLTSFSEVERGEHRINLRDLDNFIFATDSTVVVAAGNSPQGMIPNPSYPDHHADPRWALGPWACGFNTLICGAFVSRLSVNGHVRNIGWPSPFTRVGPGLCEAPVPSFSAEGGNTDDRYGWAPGLGVWCFSGAGLPEDKIGTSFAAPLLAREAALTLHQLQQHCSPGTQPFGVTARAFLTSNAADDGRLFSSTHQWGERIARYTSSESAMRGPGGVPLAIPPLRSEPPKQRVEPGHVIHGDHVVFFKARVRIPLQGVNPVAALELEFQRPIPFMPLELEPAPGHRHDLGSPDDGARQCSDPSRGRFNHAAIDRDRGRATPIRGESLQFFKGFQGRRFVEPGPAQQDNRRSIPLVSHSLGPIH